MYLYNGHRAPGLPVYDPGELPYGLIVSANGDNTSLILMLCVNRPYYGTNPSDSTKTGVYNTGRMKVYTCTDTDEAWTFSMETENPLTANDDDPGGGVLWTLEDILKTDGSVWMAGTQPVPERVSEAWVRSFKEGLTLGLTGAPLPYTGTAEPVAYLYNGVRLPPLPEWDKEAYPYAYLRTYTFLSYTYVELKCYQTLFTGSTDIWNSEGKWEWTLFSDGETLLKATLAYKTAEGIPDGKVWGDFETEENGINLGSVEVDGVTKKYRSRLVVHPSTPGFWQNFTFPAENGEAWITATDPVPVYD